MKIARILAALWLAAVVLGQEDVAEGQEIGAEGQEDLNATSTEATSSKPLAPADMAGLDATASCITEKHAFDKFQHKSVYTVGVHAIRGLDDAYDEYHKAFGEYLTATAGQQFDPPIEFQVRAFFFEAIFEGIENDEIDFLYTNPGVYSCIGTEVGATALVTAIKRLHVRDKVFDLDVYGGVIAVRADNKEVNQLSDLKDKIIAAGAIVDLMGGQMQVRKDKETN